MIEMIIQRVADGQAFDISELVGNIEWSTDILDNQPGKLRFEYVEDDRIIPHYGDVLRFRFNNTGVFFGRVFTKSRTEKGVTEVTAYDSMRFLKNKHTYVLPAMTSSQIFSRLCGDFGLTHRVVDPSHFNVAAKVHDNESLFDIIDDALGQTILNNRQWYIIRDNFGVLEHVHLNRLQTSLVVGDESMASIYDFTGSINEDTFNQVRLVRENQDTQRREVYMVKDSNNIRLWGLLQYHNSVDENMNFAQIQARAKRQLEAKNRPTRDLKITALGDLQIRAGNGIVLAIERLRSEGFAAAQRALVSHCTHVWDNGTHEMDLEIKVV